MSSTDQTSAAENAPAPAPGEAGPSSRSVIALIRDLQSGRQAGGALPAPDRRRCVEHLLYEGYGLTETAEILQVSERTVARDRVAVRSANALAAGPGFAAEAAGNLLRQAEASVGRLRRLARDRESPPHVKVEAERGAWLVAKEAVESLQRLGFLPTAAQKVQAEISAGSANGGTAPGYAELKAELARLEQIVGGASVADPDRARALVELRGEVDRLELGERVAGLARSVVETAAGDGVTDHNDGAIDMMDGLGGEDAGAGGGDEP